MDALDIDDKVGKLYWLWCDQEVHIREMEALEMDELDRDCWS